MIIRCINLNKSYDRMDNIYRYYKNFDIIRIEAIDGVKLWGDGTCDEFGRFNWHDKSLDDLISDGIICDWYHDYGDYRPPEVACSVSHAKAVLDFYNSEEDIGIIIEDDTMPLDNLENFKMPNGVDFYCLLGSDHPGKRVTINNDNSIKSLRNLSGYAITKHGADVFLESILPFWSLDDMQISLSMFDSISPGTILPIFKKRGRLVKAQAPIKSMIGLSKMARETTFTANGIKKWMPKELDSCEYTHLS